MEDIYPKTLENEFLAVYLCIIEKVCKSSVNWNKKVTFLQKFETLGSLKVAPFANSGG